MNQPPLAPGQISSPHPGPVFPGPEDPLKLAESLRVSGRRNHAVQVLNKLIEQTPQNTEALYTLGLIHAEVKDFVGARNWLGRSLQSRPDFWPAMTLRASVYQADGEHEAAAADLDQAAKLIPPDFRPTFDTQQRKTGQAADQAGKRPRLAIICGPGMDSFIHDLGRAVDGEYWVRKFIVNEPAGLKAALAWADLVWLEWANELTAAATQSPLLVEKPVVVRIHGYEIFSDLPRKIRWNVVDRLVFVAEHKRQLFFKTFGDLLPPERTVMIRNGVDLNRFSIAPHKLRNKEVAFIGYINSRKEPILLLQFFHELLKKDPEFRLHIRGTHQEPRLQLAMEHMITELGMGDRVVFRDRVPDLNEWLADKSYVISSSIEESFHYSIAEGMAAGVKPVVHAWRESRDLWPEKYIYRDLDEFLNIMLAEHYAPEEYREWVQARYSLEILRDQVVPLFNQLRENSQVRRIHQGRSLNEINQSQAVNEFVVVDASITKISGHGMMLARDYTALLPKAKAKVVAARTLTGQKFDGVDILPLLPSFSQGSINVMEVAQAIFAQTSENSLLFFQSGDYTPLTTMLALLLGQVRKVGLMYHISTTLMTCPPEARRIFDDLINKAQHLYIFGTTDHAVRAARKMFPHHPRIYLANDVYYYFHHQRLYEESRQRDLNIGPEIRVAYFGVSRIEKGFHLLPPIVANAPRDFVFHIQASPLASGVFEPAVQQALQHLSAMKSVVFHQDMTPEQFKAYLFTGHVSLMLYDPDIYYHRLSSIYTESLASGVPIVMTRDLWYSRELEAAGAGLGVNPGNPWEVIEAVRTIAADFAGYSQRARAAFANLFAKHNNKLFLEKVLSVML